MRARRAARRLLAVGPAMAAAPAAGRVAREPRRREQSRFAAPAFARRRRPTSPGYERKEFTGAGSRQAPGLGMAAGRLERTWRQTTAAARRVASPRAALAGDSRPLSAEVSRL